MVALKLRGAHIAHPQVGSKTALPHNTCVFMDAP